MPEQGGSPGQEAQEQDQRSHMERLQAGEVVRQNAMILTLL